MQNNSNLYIHKSILSAIHHMVGTVILHVNLYISSHTSCSRITNVIDYNVMSRLL